MQLSHDANVVAACPIDLNDRFHRQLEFIGNVDRAGVDRAGGAFFAAEIGGLRREIPFDDRDHAVDEPRQTQILHARFQIGHAVLGACRPN